MGSGMLLTMTMRTVLLQHLLTLFSRGKLLFLSRMKRAGQEWCVLTEADSSDFRLGDSSGDLTMMTLE